MQTNNNVAIKKVAAHISFFYNKNRLKYLKTVIDNLLQLPADIDIFIYTNKRFDFFSEHKNIKHLVYSYKKSWVSKFSFNHFTTKLGIKYFVNPFYLTWENRKNIELSIDDYDVQIYLEDDICFTKENFNYWLHYKDIALAHGYNLGFLRVEKDSNNNLFITDLKDKPTEIIEIEGKKYLKNTNYPYCGFWIYDQKELREFIKSKEWLFNFKGDGIREKSAIGWHGKNMDRYKDTIIPLEQGENQYQTSINCKVHHLPNNYIGHAHFCILKFPIVYSNV